MGLNEKIYIHYHEYDFNKEYPTLVIQGDMMDCGYSIDLSTGEVTPVCICAATCPEECCCGYDWGSEEEWYYD